MCVPTAKVKKTPKSSVKIRFCQILVSMHDVEATRETYCVSMVTPTEKGKWGSASNMSGRREIEPLIEL